MFIENKTTVFEKPFDSDIKYKPQKIIGSKSISGNSQWETARQNMEEKQIGRAESRV